MRRSLLVTAAAAVSMVLLAMVVPLAILVRSYALEDRLEGRSKRGASTLTQQLAKNLFLWPGQSWLRKVLEVYFTVLDGQSEF